MKGKDWKVWVWEDSEKQIIWRRRTRRKQQLWEKEKEGTWKKKKRPRDG